MKRLILTLIIFTVPYMAFGQLKKAANDMYDVTTENRIGMWFGNNGSLGHKPSTDGSGVEWPRGSGKLAVFQEGFLFGGYILGERRVGGSTYRQGLEAGPILADGSPDNPNSPANRIYRAHRFDAAWWNGLTEDEKLRLRADLLEWPVELGAPWTDANGNGVYDPDATAWEQGGTTDTPLLPGDEVFWYVCNDLDGSRAYNLYGTGPVGMEVRTMIWSSAGHPLLDNVVFRMHTLVHKGVETLVDMHLGAWEDPDLGDYANDFVGVDTALGLMYTYNDGSADDIYGIGPASGTLWLQTPAAPKTGATAQFGFGTLQDHENLPLSGFVHYINGDPVYQDPDLGVAEGSVQMMNNLHGLLYNGTPLIDPVTGRESRFCMPGDPVTGRGWIDGILHHADDRRQLSASGGIDLAPGDTHVVIFARIVAEADNQLLAVRALRNDARQLQDLYRNLPFGATAPVFSSAVSYPASGGVEVFVSGGPFAAGTTTIEAVLRSFPGGSEIVRVPLVDDGTNGDAVAGDGVYGNTFAVVPQATGADLFIETVDGGGTRSWFVESEIALPGQARVRVADIVSDSRNFDGEANAGENVRLALRIENLAAVPLGDWHLFPLGDACMQSERAVQRRHVSIDGGASQTPLYDAADPDSYLAVDIPADTPPGPFRLPVILMSDDYCLWHDTLVIDVVEPPQPPVEGLLAHVQGRAFGTLGYVVTDRGALTDHAYRVLVDGEDFASKTLRVEDVTLGATLYRGLPIPQRFAHDMPDIDGWRITIGTTFHALVYDAQGERLASFTENPVGTYSEPSRAWMNFYIGGLMTSEDFFGSKLRLYDLVPVRLVFDRVNGQKGMCWLRGGTPNYGYQGYFDIPLRAYDISDPGNPRQLMVGFVEQKGSSLQDNTWMPVEYAGEREYLFIFNDSYSDTVEEKFKDPILQASENLDGLYGFWPVRDPRFPLFEDGDMFTIDPHIPMSNRDVYITPLDILMDVRSTPASPSSLALRAPYPNPVRERAEIVFDTRAAGSVLLAVHDLLGRRVTTLVDRPLERGTHRVTLSAAGLRSGTYVVSLTSGSERATRMISVVR